MNNKRIKSQLNVIWSTPLQYWRLLISSLERSLRPSGPRDRLLHKCRKKKGGQASGGNSAGSFSNHRQKASEAGKKGCQSHSGGRNS